MVKFAYLFQSFNHACPSLFIVDLFLLFYIGIRVAFCLGMHMQIKSKSHQKCHTSFSWEWEPHCASMAYVIFLQLQHDTENSLPQTNHTNGVASSHYGSKRIFKMCQRKLIRNKCKKNSYGFGNKGFWNKEYDHFGPCQDLGCTCVVNVANSMFFDAENDKKCERSMTPA